MLRRWAALYADPTPAEQAIEPAIASLGVPYRFQHPLWALSVFPDFVLPAHRLVIEVDDASHARPAKKRADAERTKKIEGARWRVVRCTNDRLCEQAGLSIRTRRP
jgi:very-short-patch-repair endonuclease